MTHVLQTTATATRQAMARPVLKVIVNQGLWTGSLVGAADWPSPVTSHGIPEAPRAGHRSAGNWQCDGHTAAPKI